VRVIEYPNLGASAITNVTFQRNDAKNTFSIVVSDLPTAHTRKKKTFQVVVIRWYYVYDPWRNIKRRGEGDTNADS
jgi:hypothetical protein